MDHKRRSLKELDKVIEEILRRAPKEWFECVDSIIDEQKKNCKNPNNTKN